MHIHQELATIPSNYARIIGRELGLNLREIPELIKFTGLSTQDFMQEDLLLTPSQFIQILQNSLFMAQHVNFGLALGKKLTSTTHGMMGFLVNNSPNIHIALKAFQNFLPTRISFAQAEVKYSKHSAIATLNFNLDLPTEVHRMLSEICLVILYECAEFIIGQPMYGSQIHFTHPQPDYFPIYAEYLSGECHFLADALSVEIPLSLCDIPNVSANQEHYVLAMTQCEKLIQELKPHARNYRYEIQKLMLSHPLTEISEEYLAHMLFISKRTLSRKLKEEGVTYRILLEEIKAKQAVSYLCENKLSVETVANLLNYHDSSSFRRAFKRWFHVTPENYRKKSKHCL